MLTCRVICFGPVRKYLDWRSATTTNNTNEWAGNSSWFTTFLWIHGLNRVEHRRLTRAKASATWRAEFGIPAFATETRHWSSRRLMDASLAVVSGILSSKACNMVAFPSHDAHVVTINYAAPAKGKSQDMPLTCTEHRLKDRRRPETKSTDLGNSFQWPEKTATQHETCDTCKWNSRRGVAPFITKGALQPEEYLKRTSPRVVVSYWKRCFTVLPPVKSVTFAKIQCAINYASANQRMATGTWSVAVNASTSKLVLG